jgi:hypothetical protein
MAKTKSILPLPRHESVEASLTYSQLCLLERLLNAENARLQQEQKDRNDGAYISDFHRVIVEGTMNKELWIVKQAREKVFESLSCYE